MPVGNSAQLKETGMLGDISATRALVQYLDKIVAYVLLERAVDRDLGEVGPQPVPVGVVVGEEPGLQHLVRAGLDARDQVVGAEGRLLHLGEVVTRVAVQHQAAHLEQRIFLKQGGIKRG